MLSRQLIAGGLAAIALAVSAGVALASPGQAISNVNVRSGPGTSYKIITQLKAGDLVDIAHCQSGWCYVGLAGATDGWVSQSYLEHLSAPVIVPPPIVVRPHIVVRPPYHPHRPPHRPVKPRPPHKPRPPICNGKPQIQICLPKK